MLYHLVTAAIRTWDRWNGMAVCRDCGCTDHAACEHGCWWIEPDLCSNCATPEQVRVHDLRAEGFLV